MDSIRYLRTCCFVFVISGFTSTSFAKTCITTKSAVQETSEKIKDKFSIEISKNGDEYLVSIFMPNDIGGKLLDGAYFYKGTSYFDAVKDDYEFSMPLGIHKDDKGMQFTFYTIKEKYISDNHIGFVYGKGCGTTVEYPVNYSSVQD